MNLIDSIIRPFSPGWALKRAQARQLLAMYEAARPSRTRRNPGDNRSGNAVVDGAGATLRAQARHLDQNHDLARGILTTLVNNVVGANGIGVEFQPKNLDGSVNRVLADELAWYWAEWCRSPETSGKLDWAMTQRLVARSWFRDGEVLAKSVVGTVPKLNHRSLVPYSLELIEADQLAETSNPAEGIIQGVQMNSWGQPRYYMILDQHPGDGFMATGKVRMINADVIDHIALVDRIRQVRGVSVFASVMNRLNDLKDYEDSERVAARISAAMAGFIKKGTPDMYMAPEDGEDREFPLEPGVMFDNLAPGEDVGTIQSNRPSMLLQPFRDAMLRAIAAGTSSGYSSISRNYDGTYSAQRQELIEQWVNYGALSHTFIAQFVSRVVRRFISTAIAFGVKLPADIDPDTLYDVDYLTPAMPWIAPEKEAIAHEKNLDMRLTSPQAIIRSRGQNPDDILDQWQSWYAGMAQRSIPITPTNPAQERGFSSDEEKPE